MSEANKGKNHPKYGKNHTEETKTKISDATKIQYLSEVTKGNNHPMYGQNHSEETFLGSI